MEQYVSVNSAEFLHEVRAALSSALPCGPTLIPLDILLAITKAADAGHPLNVKQLCHELPHSVTGIRYNLDQLLSNDWIRKERSRSDARTVALLPTKRAEESLLSAQQRIMILR